MKRILLFLFLALLLLSLGFGGGVFAGRTWLSPEGGSPGAVIEEPGPVFFVGDFISNLAGAGNHVVNFKLSMEMSSPRALEMIASPSWLARVKNEVILLTKDRLFEDLTNAEGILALAEDIKRTINAIMPPVRDKAPVVRVLFEGFVLQ
ncbi:flagellar basal body-associated FliL family protein [Aminivibrio sp.]|jgi:flagellar FliL protein|uniref:flagellar basal body-associated FliL family protein n=1 Tax=Aminivibrio sp. TaxID=1872489 RepID=UPI001A634D81|nr:flagellar basal body-associated FliL family protein [Aminivibrio sp.]MBL3538762.1 flagellar basal body-associated FliL family protein [Aminivibrio sp.]MDK2958181.1 flagellar protein FliL [Synergistaceae bacterium]